MSMAMLGAKALVAENFTLEEESACFGVLVKVGGFRRLPSDSEW
jgi:hypothetical protein